MKAANLVLRFVLELCSLAAVGYWGWTTGDGAMRWALAIGSVAVVITVWALFVSPKHTIETSKQVSLAIELAVWVATGAALHATGHGLLALAFAMVSVISGLLNYAWR
jgi:hypothetical protein